MINKIKEYKGRVFALPLYRTIVLLGWNYFPPDFLSIPPILNVFKIMI